MTVSVGGGDGFADGAGCAGRASRLPGGVGEGRHQGKIVITTADGKSMDWRGALALGIVKLGA